MRIFLASKDVKECCGISRVVAHFVEKREVFLGIFPPYFFRPNPSRCDFFRLFPAFFPAITLFILDLRGKSSKKYQKIKNLAFHCVEKKTATVENISTTLALASRFCFTGYIAPRPIRQCPLDFRLGDALGCRAIGERFWICRASQEAP